MSNVYDGIYVGGLLGSRSMAERVAHEMGEQGLGTIYPCTFAWSMNHIDDVAELMEGGTGTGHSSASMALQRAAQLLPNESVESITLYGPCVPQVGRLAFGTLVKTGEMHIKALTSKEQLMGTTLFDMGVLVETTRHGWPNLRHVINGTIPNADAIVGFEGLAGIVNERKIIRGAKDRYFGRQLQKREPEAQSQGITVIEIPKAHPASDHDGIARLPRRVLEFVHG